MILLVIMRKKINLTLIKSILKNYWPLILIVIVSGFLLFFRMNRDLLKDWDECVYTQYGIEMKKTGNLLNNQWNESLVFEKPPLNAIIMQIPFLFKKNEFTARLPSNLFLLFLIVSVYIFAKKYFSDLVAVLSCLILLASEVIIVYGIRVNTDIGFTLFTFLGFFCWIKSFKKKFFSYLAGLFLGLAVLIKGLSILPFLTALFFSIFLNYKKEKIINYLKLLSVFIIVALPWHLIEYVLYSQKFIQVYLVEHILKRTNNPIDFHFGSNFYYLKLIYQNFFPWIFFIFTLPIFFILYLKRIIKFKSFIKTNQILITILFIILIPFTSLTIAKTKIAWYIMPIYPFIALFLTICINAFFTKIKLRFLIYLIIILVALDSIRLIIHETNFFQPTRIISRRDDVFIKAKQYAQSQINYLVWYSERKAREVLPENMQTSTTFIYGGNPCAVYHSQKKINYYYSIDEFKKRINQQKGLFVIENGDQWIVKDLPIKVLYNNIDYTIFEN